MLASPGPKSESLNPGSCARACSDGGVLRKGVVTAWSLQRAIVALKRALSTTRRLRLRCSPAPWLPRAVALASGASAVNGAASAAVARRRRHGSPAEGCRVRRGAPGGQPQRARPQGGRAERLRLDGLRERRGVQGHQGPELGGGLGALLQRARCPCCVACRVAVAVCAVALQLRPLALGCCCSEARLADLILIYLGVNASGHFKYLSLKAAHKKLATRFPDLVRSPRSPETWAAETSDRLKVLLCHSRRLADDTRWAQAVGHLAPHHVEQLASLRAFFSDGPSSACGSTPSRVLMAQHSEASVDSLGLPS